MAAKRGSTAKSKREAKLEARVAELSAALEQARSASSALRKVGMAVGTSASLDDLLELIVQTTTEVLHAERATLYMLEGAKLVSRIKIGEGLQTIEVELGQGIAGHVAMSGKSMRVANAYRSPRFDRSWDKLSGYRTRSILAVPIKDPKGETIGVMQMLNKLGPDGTPRIFTPYDTQLLTALAAQAAVSIDKGNLFGRLLANNKQLAQTTKRLERTLRDLEILYELETAMGRADTLPELACRVITKVGEACKAAAGALLHQAQDGELTIYVVNLKRADVVREVIVQPGEGIAGRAMQQKLLRIDDPKLVRDPARVRELLGINVRSAIAASLQTGDGPAAGALALYNHRSRRPSRFSKEDAYLLRLVSANVSTELRRLHARELRERAERMESIGQLLSGVMHDLRTPLTVISGFVQLLQTTRSEAKRSEYGQTIMEQFQLIGAMQRDLLAYARGETNLLIRKVYLGKFFDDLERQFASEAGVHDISFRLELDERGVAFFDEPKMARALHNLVRNAIEAMYSKGGSLALSCRRDDEDLIISVADTGPGIPKTIRAKLFKPFVTAGKKTGTGLGLANVKKIVEQHGGRVDVRSSRSGTCFTVRLPLAMRPHSMRPPE